MSDIGTDELPEDVAKLLGAAKELRGPSDAVRASMKARLVAALPPPGGGGGGGGNAPTGSAGGSTFPRVPAWVAAATFAAGLAAGVLVRPAIVSGGGLAPNVEVAKTTDVAKTAPSVATGPVAATLVPSDLPLVASAIPVATPASATSAGATTATHTNRGSDLAAERAVLDMARTALNRGDPANALAATAEHEKRYPRGALAEEREAIAVRALSEGGRKAEAKARAERFKKSHPESILLPAVLAAGGVE